MNVENITKEQYYERLLGIWNRIIDNTLNGSELVAEYSICYKFCTSGKEDIVYSAYKELFKTVSSTDIKYEDYCKASKLIHHICSYFDRHISFYQRSHNDMKELNILSEETWNNTHNIT